MKLVQIGGREGLTVLLFGLGLIGRAVDHALRLRYNAAGVELPYSWTDPEARDRQRADLRARLTKSGPVALVWAGGQNGFGATEADMDQETALLSEVINFAVALGRDRPVAFHLTSSAGGLFEGQTHCGPESRPRPMRPYGAGKLAQEALLRSASGLQRRLIYRPTSVYGMKTSRRIGLVTALVSNALYGRVTRITGSPYTLRDFLLADDIGEYMVQQIADPEPDPDTRTLLLAHGRSASVFEVIERIRRLVERPVLLQYDSRPTNAGDMSFLPSALPPDWYSTNLESGISRTLSQFRSGFTWGRS